MTQDFDSTEPEELPMDVVLGEIRKQLLKDISNETISTDVSVSFVQSDDAPDYFLLTPGMRCDTEINAVEETDDNQTPPLPEAQPLSQLDTALESWLNNRLPEMLEKIVRRELKK